MTTKSRTGHTVLAAAFVAALAVPVAQADPPPHQPGSQATQVVNQRQLEQRSAEMSTIVNHRQLEQRGAADAARVLNHRQLEQRGAVGSPSQATFTISAPSSSPANDGGFAWTAFGFGAVLGAAALAALAVGVGLLARGRSADRVPSTA